MRYVVSISGAIGSGKSTLAEMLIAPDPEHSAHLETSSVVAELCDTFNEGLSELGTPAWQTPVPAANQALQRLLPALSTMTRRPLTLADIDVGEAAVQQNPDWYARLFDYLATVKQSPALVTQAITATNKGDYRALMQWLGGYVLYRLNYPLLWYKELMRRISELPGEIRFVALTAPRQPAEAEFVQKQHGKVILIKRAGIESDTAEVTERRVLEIRPDATMYNDGSLAELQRCAEAIRADVMAGHLAAEYRATTRAA